MELRGPRGFTGGEFHALAGAFADDKGGAERVHAAASPGAGRAPVQVHRRRELAIRRRSTYHARQPRKHQQLHRYNTYSCCLTTTVTVTVTVGSIEGEK